MARSIWKLPYISPAITRLLKRESKKNVTDLNTTKKKNITISTYSRNTVIIPALLDKTIKVYIGNKFLSILITTEMLGHKLGEFALTRKKYIPKQKKITKTTTK